MGSPAGICVEPKAVQTCSLANITLMKGKIVTLQQLQRSIEGNWRDCEKARSGAELNNAMLLSLRLVKASCDAVLGVAEALAPKVIEKQAKTVVAAYSAADPLATMVGKKFAGETVTGADWAKAATAGAASAAKVYGVRAGGPGGDLIDSAASLQKVNADVVIDAIKQDESAIGKDMNAYVWKLAELTAKMYQTADNLETKSKASAFKKFAKISKQVIGTGLNFYKAYKDWKKDDMNASLEGIKKTFEAQHKHVQTQIDALVRTISDCENQLQMSLP